MQKTFLICPVRGVSLEQSRTVVEALESAGWQVHWPHRDTDQTDDIGLRICQDNRAGIEEADVVHVIWYGESHGVLFDLGMAFALRKPVIPVMLPAPTPGKSFQNMVRAWATIAGSLRQCDDNQFSGAFGDGKSGSGPVIAEPVMCEGCAGTIDPLISELSKLRASNSQLVDFIDFMALRPAWNEYRMGGTVLGNDHHVC